MGEQNGIPLETVKWREGVGKTLAKIDKRTATMEIHMESFITAPQVDQKIEDANAKQLAEHSHLCGLQRQIDEQNREKAQAQARPPARKTPTSIAPPRMKNGGGFLKNLTLPQAIKYAVFLGFLIGSFVAGLQLGG